MFSLDLKCYFNPQRKAVVFESFFVIYFLTANKQESEISAFLYMAKCPGVSRAEKCPINTLLVGVHPYQEGWTEN